MKWLNSTLLGNTIGIISLIVGLIGLIITIKTMISARRIEEDIKREKAKAIDKKRFNEYKIKAIKKLDKICRAAIDVNCLSSPSYNNILSILHDLQEYNTILTSEDLINISKSREELIDISLSSTQNNNLNENVMKLDKVVAKIIHILEKGEYDL